MRIPTEFTAIDKFSAVIAKMTSGVSNFTKSTGSAVERVNTKINNTFKSLGNIVQLGLGVGLAGLFSMGIQSINEYETAIASFRTIVSDLSDKDFAKYRVEVNNVAKDTKKSAIDVALSFEKIAGLNSDLAKTADGLGLVSKASIVLSKASGDDLGISAENLVGLMNQYSLGAKDADRVTNVLAAGLKVGASSISQSSEAYKNFGAVAKSSNITLEQSQALIQMVSQKQILGAEAGTKLRGATLQLQKAGLGYKSGVFNINDALVESQKISDKLKTAKEKDAYATKVFGAENITVGKILMSNIGKYDQFTKAVTGTNEAQKQAEINTNTLAVRYDEFKNSLVNMLVSNDQTISGLEDVKNMLAFVTDNLGTIVGAIGKVVVAFLAFKAINGIIQTATFLMGLWSAAVAFYEGVALTAAFTGASFAAVIWATVWPILAVIAAIALVVAIIYNWSDITKWFSRTWETFINGAETLWLELVSALTEFDFVGLFISIGQAIIDFMLAPLKAVLGLVAMIPGGIGKAAQTGLDKLNEMTDLKMMVGHDIKKLDSPEQTNAKMMQDNRMSANMDINLRGNTNAVESTSVWGNKGLPVNVTSTQGAF